jgi:hypothetical protein
MRNFDAMTTLNAFRTLTPNVILIHDANNKAPVSNGEGNSGRSMTFSIYDMGDAVMLFPVFLLEYEQ